MKDDSYKPRTYRYWIEDKDLVSFTVTVKETDLYIRAGENLQRKARRIVMKYRAQLEKYIEKNPAFEKSMEPLETSGAIPRIAEMMILAGQQAGVGPMAAVAGAVAECVGRELLEYSPEVIVENGGDIFMKTRKRRVVGIYAGDSPLSGKIGVDIAGGDKPLGICTSSGTVGHSVSYGNADAVVVVSGSTALADAAATAIGNRVQSINDIDDAIEFGSNISDLKGLVIIKGETIGAWGDIKLCEISV
ncbi:MAG: UPF0280 family protein [Dehalococcoidia bacterium]|jgi:ApbE superfamily uncharacterized protein (UPF0280 family)